jgi:hypothetical protein
MRRDMAAQIGNDFSNNTRNASEKSIENLITLLTSAGQRDNRQHHFPLMFPLELD